MKLIVLGPSAVTVIGTVLYAVSFLLLVAMAARMRCTGQYYEDAEKFADDYQEAQRRNKTGEVAFVGKKKKYKTARVEYRGGGASAIFYRQLLEYKKERFFIFGFVTLVFLAGGLLTGWLTMREGDAMQSAVWRHYLIPGILMYLGFIFSGYKTRWAKELENPYVFLIPDSGFKKMWYATVIDHIRAAVHGLLFVVPAMIGMRISWWYLPVYLVMQVCMNAVFLYSNTVLPVSAGKCCGRYAAAQPSYDYRMAGDFGGSPDCHFGDDSCRYRSWTSCRKSLPADSGRAAGVGRIGQLCQDGTVNAGSPVWREFPVFTAPDAAEAPVQGDGRDRTGKRSISWKIPVSHCRG